jgi:hypothetical protein
VGLLRDSWDSADKVSRVFVAGVVAKGLNGVAEVVGGARSCSSCPATCWSGCSAGSPSG